MCTSQIPARNRHTTAAGVGHYRSARADWLRPRSIEEPPSSRLGRETQCLRPARLPK
ncbi:DUF2550 family protein [Patescibacteria group bacterium]|nr:DUF2550 family protein [Patescibacteria group bacterium]